MRPRELASCSSDNPKIENWLDAVSETIRMAKGP
jgi:hypothetical protein